MQSKLLHEHGGQRTFAVIMDKGDEVLSSIKDFAARERILAAQITAIGALSDVVLRYFDWDTKDYRDIPVREQVEVASLIGDVARAPDGKPASISIWWSARRTAAPWPAISAKPTCGRRWR